MTNVKVKVFETDKKSHKAEERRYLCWLCERNPIFPYL